MTDVPDSSGRPPAERDVQRVLRGESVADATDALVLAAVQDALLSVPTGSPPPGSTCRGSGRPSSAAS
ncbi:hypothetical protein [Cellulomonas soli]